MNRKEVAEQLKHVIQNQVNLIPEDYFALNEAIKELEKCCANCIHQHISSDGESLCIVNSIIIHPDILESHFCAEHERMDELEDEPF